MTEQEKLFWEIAENSNSAESGKMFGKLCIKINGKAFASFYQEEMVFKLSGLEHKAAIKLEGAKLWDPSGKNRPMKEWIQIPYRFNKKWVEFAQAAMKYVENQTK